MMEVGTKTTVKANIINAHSGWQLVPQGQRRRQLRKVNAQFFTIARFRMLLETLNLDREGCPSCTVGVAVAHCGFIVLVLIAHIAQDVCCRRFGILLLKFALDFGAPIDQYVANVSNSNVNGSSAN